MSKRILVTPCVAIGVVSLLGASFAQADEDTKVGGRLFTDVTSIDAKTNGVKTATSGVGIDVKRAYLAIDHKFDDIWSANVTTDFQYVGNDGVTNVYIKKAYVQAKLSDALVFRAGSADLPWVPFVEGLYGYRFLENTLTDRLKFGTSADWGVNANGKAGDLLNYSVSVVNGGGYKNPTRTDSMDVEGRIGFMPVNGLTVAGGFYSGKRGMKVQGGVATPNTASRFDGLVAYVKGGLRAGVEYFTAKDWNNVTTTADNKADGFSVWGSYDFSPMWGVFARADQAKISKDLDPGLKDKYFNAGVVSHPRKNVTSRSRIRTARSKAVPPPATKNGEVGVWAQVSF